MPTVKKLMEEKRVQATIGQQPWLQGYQAINTAVQYLVDDLPEQSIIIKNEIKLFENI